MNEQEREEREALTSIGLALLTGFAIWGFLCVLLGGILL
jgi:hypothetical protein